MSYTKQGFQSGDRLYASQLNAMDDQIALNENRLDHLEENATVNYNNLTNKPTLNGVTISGNQTSADFGIPSTEGIPDMVDDWLDENITNPDSPPLDRSLSSSSAAAPADLVGDELASIRHDLTHIFSDNAKTALLTCFRNVAWVDAHGQDYYDALEAALYADIYPKITAVFDAGVNVIYTDDALDTLKQYLTVKYFETKDSAGTVIASNDYTLSGVLTEGTSTVTVAYNGVRTSASIPGVVNFYNIWKWSVSSGNINIQGGAYETNQDDLEKYPSRLQYYANNTRRCITASKGKAPAYWRNQTAQSTGFFPIPIPANANHVKITMNPDGQYLFMNTVLYDSETEQYGNAIADNRIAWQQFVNGVIEKDIINSGNLFACCNFKYDSGSSAYPSDPTEIVIEFSEV